MQSSEAVRDTMLRFYDRLSENDVDAFDSLVSADPSTVVIGTAIGEIHRDRARLRFGFEMEGARIEPGSDPQAFEEGGMGWVIDEPSFFFGPIGPVVTRLTAVFRREETWKMVHMHVSVGVPDEEVTELQARWGVTA